MRHDTYVRRRAKVSAGKQSPSRNPPSEPTVKTYGLLVSRVTLRN
jgi:hypothetical protein